MGNVTFLLQKYIEFDQSDEEIITKAMVIGTTMFIIISIAFFFLISTQLPEMYDLHKQWTNEGTYSLPTEVLSEFAKLLKPFAVPPIENRMDFANHSTIIRYVILQKQWKAKNETRVLALPWPTEASMPPD